MGKIRKIRLPKLFAKSTLCPCERGWVTQIRMPGVTEVQVMTVDFYSEITKHSHDNRWEVWILPELKKAYFCPKKGEHEFINNSKASYLVIAMKGNRNYTLQDLRVFFEELGIDVVEGSIYFDD